jgi:branched-chain amino acid transport system permease protein
MFVVAWLIERLVLRHLVNQEGATLLMATLGIAYVLEGVGSSHLRQRHLQDRRRHAEGSGDDPRGTFEGGLLINKEDFVAALIAACWSGCWPVLPEDRTGRALRAVADDHQAAQSIGIPLNRIWVIVWCVAGWSRWWPA